MDVRLTDSLRSTIRIHWRSVRSIWKEQVAPTVTECFELEFASFQLAASNWKGAQRSPLIRKLFKRSLLSLKSSPNLALWPFAIICCHLLSFIVHLHLITCYPFAIRPKTVSWKAGDRHRRFTRVTLRSWCCSSDKELLCQLLHAGA